MVGGEEQLENVHITIRFLFRASTGIYLVEPQLIATYVVFDLPEPERPDGIEWFWLCLDVPPKLMDSFLKVNPQWYGERLHCSASLAGEPDMMQALATVKMFLLDVV